MPKIFLLIEQWMMLIHSKQHKPEAAVAVELYYLCQQVMWSVELVCFHAKLLQFYFFVWCCQENITIWSLF